jgi:hypothetical protein
VLFQKYYCLPTIYKKLTTMYRYITYSFDGVCMGSRMEICEESSLPDDFKRQEAQRLGLLLAAEAIQRRQQKLTSVLAEIVDEAADIPHKRR